MHITKWKGVCDRLLDDKAILAIESAVREGYTVEVKIEKGDIVVVQKREKRTITYRGLAKN